MKEAFQRLIQGNPTSNDVAIVFELALDPSRWDELDEAEFHACTYLLIMRYGYDRGVDLQSAVKRIYLAAIKRMQPMERLRLQMLVSQSVLEGKFHSHALLPFILGENQHGIIAMATFHYMMAQPLKNDDTLVGPKEILVRFKSQNPHGPARAGMLGGLLMCGDSRLAPLINGLWRELPQHDNRFALAMYEAQPVTYLTVEFLLDWLLHTKEPMDVKMIFSKLSRISIDQENPCVLSILRKFPCSSIAEVRQYHIVNQWTLPEYARLIRSTYVALVARHPELAEILDAWEDSES